MWACAACVCSVTVTSFSENQRLLHCTSDWRPASSSSYTCMILWRSSSSSSHTSSSSSSSSTSSGWTLDVVIPAHRSHTQGNDVTTDRRSNSFTEIKPRYAWCHLSANTEITILLNKEAKIKKATKKKSRFQHMLTLKGLPVCCSTANLKKNQAFLPTDWTRHRILITEDTERPCGADVVTLLAHKPSAILERGKRNNHYVLTKFIK